ncbi:hypothetical protein [Nitrososphaera viennensis]|uniref:Uncharacterized protein n=1 Tax=Nitrososphaera viennensis TaxID=1034015 RepID=A0A977NLI9_9ARCH|nr:hypothetical protein [Nitrososphaera viennensis]UVS68361.1 hypothetical protein NWT39_10680 [Nitrososphaera viennensis]
MPAITIAEMLSVEKNIIDNDIQLLYRELGKEWKRIDFDEYIFRQIIKLDTQRGRLASYLDKADDVDKKLAIERMIANIDFKIVTMVTKAEQLPAAFWNAVYSEMNKVAKEKKLDWRFTTLWEGVKVSRKARNKMDEVLRAES